MSIADPQLPVIVTDPDVAKFAGGAKVKVIGETPQPGEQGREFTVITRHYLWDHGRREYHYRLFREIGNGRCEMTWKRESELEGAAS